MSFWAPILQFIMVRVDIFGRRSSPLKWCVVLLFISVAGCGNKFFDPTQIGRFRPVPAVNVILDSLGVAEEAPSALSLIHI